MLNMYLIWTTMKTCINSYVQRASMLTEQEVKMQLFHPEALNFEHLSSRKQWNVLLGTAPLGDQLNDAEQEGTIRNEM